MESVLFHIGVLGIICLPEIITAASIFLLAIFYSGIKALITDVKRKGKIKKMKWHEKK